MAHTGEMIDNPVTYDRVIFRVTAQDTKGALLEFKVLCSQKRVSRNPLSLWPEGEHQQSQVIAGHGADHDLAK